MMQGWKSGTIKDYGQVVTGHTPPTAQDEYWGEGYKFVTPTDLNFMNYFVGNTGSQITESARTKFNKKFLPPYSVSYTCIGTIGKSCLNREWLLTNQQINSIIPTKEHDYRFIYYQLNCLKETIVGAATGAATPIINKSKFEGIKVKYPSLQIQQKIGSLLAAYDDLIENNLKRIKLLEEMAQITYEEWFVHLRFPGHESTPINPETGLPEGWETKAISTICDVNKNSITARSAPETIRYIDISSTETGYYTTPQEMPFSEAPSRARRRVAFGDTIFSTVRPNRRIFSLVLENDPLLVASTGFAVLTPHRAQNFPFIYLTIAQQSFTDAAIAVAGGAAYPAVNQTDFERIKITVPTQELMNKFSDAFVPNFTIKGQLQRENALLREARDILLPRLMTGVIDAENYDPAQLLKEAA